MQKYLFRSYSAIFPLLFEEEKRRLAKELPSDAIIEHVGSTAVPDLGGKGIIDIAIAVKEEKIPSASLTLQSLGYQFRESFSTQERHYLIMDRPDPEQGRRRYHIHLTHKESVPWKGLLRFRDHLRSDPKEAKAYSDLKEAAIKTAAHNGKIYQALKEPYFKRFFASD